jgi:HCOMODA/2-hydroxy-3-carboxy-muconic semialdehyde decarboxylase
MTNKPSIPLAFLGTALLCLATPPAQAQASLAPGVAAAAARLGVDPQVIDDLVTANRILAHEGILDAYGHVSIRSSSNPNHYLMAKSVAPELVTAADIVEYDLDSNPVSASAPQGYMERFIHGEIYRARPEVAAVVHSHSPSVIPFSVSSVPLRPVYHMAAFLVGGVPVWDSVTANDPEAAGILVRNNALGASLAATLGKKPVVLMRGHGSVVVSRGLKVSVKNAIILEENARLQTAAIALGGTIKYIAPEEAMAMARGGGDLDRAWDYWKQRALKSK